MDVNKLSELYKSQQASGSETNESTESTKSEKLFVDKEATLEDYINFDTNVDLNNDGIVDQSEIEFLKKEKEKLGKILKENLNNNSLDVNKDGKIDINDVEAFAQMSKKADLNDEDTKNIFEAFKEGLSNFFNVLTKSLKECLGNAQLANSKENLKKFDLDNDGKITDKDLEIAELSISKLNDLTIDSSKLGINIGEIADFDFRNLKDISIYS